MLSTRNFLLSHFPTFPLSHFHTFTLSHFPIFPLSHFPTFPLFYFPLSYFPSASISPSQLLWSPLYWNVTHLPGMTCLSSTFLKASLSPKSPLSVSTGTWKTNILQISNKYISDLWQIYQVSPTKISKKTFHPLPYILFLNPFLGGTFWSQFSRWLVEVILGKGKEGEPH